MILVDLIMTFKWPTRPTKTLADLIWPHLNSYGTGMTLADSYDLGRPPVTLFVVYQN